MKKTVFLLLCLSIVLLGCDHDLSNPQNYTGTATRTETNCLAGDCMSCTSTDTIRIELNTSRGVTLTTTGPCMAFGAECIYREDLCSWSVEGEYHGDKGKLEFSSCNDRTFEAQGKGEFGEGKSSGSLKCLAKNGTDYTTIRWLDVPIIKAN